MVYGASLTIGESTALSFDESTLPTADESADTVTIDAWNYKVSGDCTIDAASGALTLGSEAAAGDVCLVTPIASAAGYIDYVAPATSMTVEAGTLDFTNGGTNPADYTGKVLRVGFSAAVNIPAGSVDDNSVAVTWGAWRVEGDDVDGADDTDGNVCTIDGDGVVTAGGTAASVGDTCTVFAVASADNYNDSAERALGTLTIAAEGDFAQLTLTAPTYTEDLVVRGYPVAIATEPTVSEEVEGLTWTYSAEGSRGGSPVENICSVNEKDGTVTAGTDAVVGDVCAIVATADAPGYAMADATAVELILHDTFTSLAWSAFPVDATVGVDVNLSASSKRPTTTPVLAGTTYTIRQGFWRLHL